MKLEIALVFESSYYDKSVEIRKGISKLGHTIDQVQSQDIEKYNCVISIFPQPKQTHERLLRELCHRTIIHISVADSPSDVPEWYHIISQHSVNITEINDCIESIHAISTTLSDISK